jgi:pimeloyl-ACP methyl ester carboxylesterase
MKKMPLINGIYYFANNMYEHNSPPVLLIHGAGGSHLSWPAEIRRIPGQRILAVDLPGHGKSDGLGKNSMHEYAHSVLELMDDLGLYKAILVGHSMGGGIVLNFALDFPDRVLGLGLIATNARLRVAQAILDGLAHERTSMKAIETIVDWSFGPQVEEPLKKLAARLLAETRPAVLRNDLLACNSFDVIQRLPEINKPALIVCGTEDRMTPLRFSEIMAGQLQGAALQTIDNAGHLVMQEQPRRVANLLTVFIKSIEYIPGV